jgi:hypothetical protein
MLPRSIALAALAALLAAPAPARQGDDERTRNAFLETRPAPAKKSPPPRRSKGKGTARAKGSKAAPAENGSMPRDLVAGAAASDMASRPLGFGYTVFMRDGSGNAARANPRQQFRAGDSVRFLVEPNVDGFLYIFNADAAGTRMIFPDPRLFGGSNRFAAHVPTELPSRAEPDAKNHWFVFDDTPGVDRVYFVVSRQPLEGVPIGNALQDYYNQGAGQYWSPPAHVWARIAEAAGQKVEESYIADAGKPLTRTETDAVSRGLGMPQGAPPPTVIRVNAAGPQDIHVTVVELSHVK